MKENLAIIVKKISKTFRLRNEHLDEKGQKSNEYVALDDISFEVQKGTTVGIIGPNGSGKSTLLKILAGITKPSSGMIQLKGKVASILDIGAGFHPELSGVENILLNGQIHGFSKKEIQSKIDDIIEFSGVRSYIHEPVKNYSNGMYLRLAFSIIAHLDFDIYLMDEVLTVGDAQFIFKVKERIQDLKRKEKTLIIVSHNLTEIQDADYFISLNAGKLISFDNRLNTLFRYSENAFLKQNEQKYFEKNCIRTVFELQEGKEILDLLRLSLSQTADDQAIFTSNRSFEFNLSYSLKKEMDGFYPVLRVNNFEGNALFFSADFLTNPHIESTSTPGIYQWKCVIPEHIFNSNYFKVDIMFVTLEQKQLNDYQFSIIPKKVLKYDNLLTFKVLMNPVNPNLNVQDFPGYLNLGLKWEKNV